MRNKGIVVKTKDSNCIILTTDGTYHKVPRSRVSNPTVGAESEFSQVFWVNRIKPLLMVACLLIAVLSFNFYQMTALADPVAYVSLDINPSIELGVDKNSRVVTVQALNKDAEKLLKGLDIKGTDLHLATRQILDGAAALGYIKPEEENYILSTVTPADNSPNVIDYDKMAGSLEKSVKDKDLDVNFVVLSAEPTLRKEAMNKGVSAGKLLVYKNSVNSGKKLSLEQVKQSSVTTLVKENKVLLQPSNKGFVKMIRVPRKNGHLKKSGSEPKKDTSAVKYDPTSPAGKTAKGLIKTKQGENEKTEKGYPFFNKLREILKQDKQEKQDKQKKQDNTDTPNTSGNSDNGSKDKQGGNNKKIRPADPVRKVDKDYQNKIDRDDNQKKHKNSDTKDTSSKKQKSEKSDIPDNKKRPDKKTGNLSLNKLAFK